MELTSADGGGPRVYTPGAVSGLHPRGAAVVRDVGKSLGASVPVPRLSAAILPFRLCTLGLQMRLLSEATQVIRIRADMGD